MPTLGGGERVQLFEVTEVARGRVLLLSLRGQPPACFEYLVADGYDVQVVTSAQEGVSAALTGSFDVLLADTTVRPSNGIDIVTRLRADPRTSLLPIIVLSDGQARTENNDSVDLEVDEYIATSMPPDWLLARISAHVALGRSRHAAFNKEAQRRQQAEHLQDRLAFLVTVDDALTTLDPDVIGRVVTRLVVPRLADACTLDVLDAHGALRNVAVAHTHVAHDERIREGYVRFPLALHSAHPTAVAIQTGQVQFVSLSDAMVKSVPDLAPVHELGLRAALVIPLVTRGEVLGALSYFSSTAERWPPTDQTLAEAVTRRVATALANARQYHEARHAEESYRQLFWKGLRSLLGDAPDPSVPAAGVDTTAAPNLPNARLTGRERDVLQALAAGGSTRGIATQLGVSDNTVRYYLKHLFTKLQLHSRAELIVFALRAGLAIGPRLTETAVASKRPYPYFRPHGHSDLTFE
jgi:DNA-binding NarL/FixJ family response regulator